MLDFWKSDNFWQYTNVFWYVRNIFISGLFIIVAILNMLQIIKIVKYLYSYYFYKYKLPKKDINFYNTFVTNYKLSTAKKNKLHTKIYEYCKSKI